MCEGLLKNLLQIQTKNKMDRYIEPKSHSWMRILHACMENSNPYLFYDHDQQRYDAKLDGQTKKCFKMT